MPFPSLADITRSDSITGALQNVLGLTRAGAGSTSSSSMILSARGTFYWVSISDSSSPGMYAIEELSRFISKQTFGDPNSFGPVDPNSSTALPPILLTAIEFNQTDITSEMPCLNNVKVFYTFGQNFGQVQIMGEVLLGPLGNDQQHNRGFRLIRDFFSTYRVSKYNLPVAVSIANEVYFVYLKGLRVGQIDPNFHVMPFMLFGTLLDISREESNKVNLASTVVTSGNVQTASLISALQATQPNDLTIADTTTATSTPTQDTSTDINVAQPGAGISTDTTGKIGTPKAAIIKATQDGNVSDDMKAYEATNQTIGYMQSTHANLQQPLADAAEDNYQYQIERLRSAQSTLGDRIVASANNQAPPAIPADNDVTLSDYGINPVTAAWHPEQFGGLTPAVNANQFGGSMAQQVATGSTAPVSTPAPFSREQTISNDLGSAISTHAGHL